MGRKIKTGISDYQFDFHRFNYTGNVAVKQVNVACGMAGFCGTQFENHCGGGLTALSGRRGGQGFFFFGMAVCVPFEDVCRGPGQANNLATIKSDTVQFISLGEGACVIADIFRRNSSECLLEFTSTIFPIIPVTS